MNNGFVVICQDCNESFDLKNLSTNDYDIEISRNMQFEENAPTGEFTEIKCKKCGNYIQV